MVKNDFFVVRMGDSEVLLYPRSEAAHEMMEKYDFEYMGNALYVSAGTYEILLEEMYENKMLVRERLMPE